MMEDIIASTRSLMVEGIADYNSHAVNDIAEGTVRFNFENLNVTISHGNAKVG